MCLVGSWPVTFATAPSNTRGGYEGYLYCITGDPPEEYFGDKKKIRPAVKNIVVCTSTEAIDGVRTIFAIPK